MSFLDTLVAIRMNELKESPLHAAEKNLTANTSEETKHHGPKGTDQD